ncbi:MAG TPA: Gfo/Idh/MocA family oxidoreductase [Chryseosolibacter sp.]|nr:Gfo/Idh/MocA family oxidoreductase [Chryseosolibacter sp.]
MKTRLIFLLVVMSSIPALGKKPFRIGIAGLTHTHVHWILERADDGDIEIVGIAEANRALAERFLAQHRLPLTLVYTSLEEMLEKAKPEAVTAFNSIYEHLQVVKACAPRKIHVMVEKPLAVSLAHAREMQQLAKFHGILLLTNYETTWYGSHHKAVELLSKLGGIRKMVVHDGHQGPQEIGVNEEFLSWLTDPGKNGGGALMDFGCYGANLITWLMKGQRPVTVTAVTQQIKPDIYPKVDDEATIILTYPKTQGIIQASWNWPFSRKDIEIYAEQGYVIADREGIRTRADENKDEGKESAAVPAPPLHDPFAYLAAAVRGEIAVEPFSLSSLENNMIVMEILEAAKKSSSEGKTIPLPLK